MTFTSTILKTAAIGAALMTSTSALAQWQGTWDTRYGNVKLQQTQNHVYGDYGTWGTIEGLVSKDRRTVRGVYKRNDDGSSGYFEWRLTTTSGFSGRWSKPQQALPVWNRVGTSWTGTRKTAAKPRLTVYRGNGNIGTFMGAQQAKYQNWASVLYSSGGTSASRPDTSSLGQSNATSILAPQAHPLANRLPKLNDYGIGFKPQWFEVTLDTISGRANYEQRHEFFGIIGIYAYCETASGSRSLTSFGGLKPRVVDAPRSRPIFNRSANGKIALGTDARRKFRVDEACLRDPRGRLKVQLQTNIKEKEPGGGAIDEVYGYRSLHFYLDEMPASDGEDRLVTLRQSDSVNLKANGGQEAEFVTTSRRPNGAARQRSRFSIAGTVRYTQ